MNQRREMTMLRMKLCIVSNHQPRASKIPHCNDNLSKEPNL